MLGIEGTQASAGAVPSCSSPQGAAASRHSAPPSTGRS